MPTDTIKIDCEETLERALNSFTEIPRSNVESARLMLEKCATSIGSFRWGGSPDYLWRAYWLDGQLWVVRPGTSCDVFRSGSANDCHNSELAKAVAEYFKPIDPDKLDEFTQAYITCALWSTTDNADDSGGEPLDANYSPGDISQETLYQIRKDCANFQRDNAADITEENLLQRSDYSAAGAAGHDFWLTREGHGAGFWETSDWKAEPGERLTAAAHAFGEFNLYVGDDGLIYH